MPLVILLVCVDQIIIKSAAEDVFSGPGVYADDVSKCIRPLYPGEEACLVVIATRGSVLGNIRKIEACWSWHADHFVAGIASLPLITIVWDR